MNRLHPRNWSEARTFYGDDDGGGQGGGTGGNDAQRRSSADVLNQYGTDTVRMADRVAALEGENYRYREQRRELQEQVKALTANQRPDGATILTGDEATAYAAYVALGKPDELQAALTERDTLAGEVKTAKRDSLIREVAQVAAYNPAVLTKLGGDLDFQIKTVTEGDTTTKAAYVTTAQGEQPLAAYAAAQWGDFLPALAATQQGGTQGQRAQGVPYPAQQGSQGQRPVNPLHDFIQQRNERAANAPNPLATT